MNSPVRAGPPALRELPLCDPSEIEEATGFVRTVRSLVTVPLTSLGVLGSVAALLAGNMLAATLAIAATAGVVVSLFRDTRFSSALDRLRIGRVEDAEHGMASLARGERAPARQRGRAQAYLSAIAWARGQHGVALRWARARRWTLEHVGAPADERFLNDASIALLLVLTGELDDAAQAVAQLGPAPPGERWCRAEAAAYLSLAFARDDVDAVRPRLAEWSSLSRAEAPLVSAWMAWALTQAHDHAAAQHAATHARADLEAVALHCPRLADWLARFDDARLRYRSR